MKGQCGKVRVLAGKRRGVMLKSRRGLATRPLQARVKKSLFSILAPRISDCAFLDLFAGSGNVGIEALSQGARSCWFVEKDKQSVRLIRDNVAKCAFTQFSKIVSRDVISFLEKPSFDTTLFDIVFVGAPYGKQLADETLRTLSRWNNVKDTLLIVTETHRRDPLSDSYGALRVVREEAYSQTILRFYTYTSPPSSPS